MKLTIGKPSDDSTIHVWLEKDTRGEVRLYIQKGLEVDTLLTFFDGKICVSGRILEREPILGLRPY